MRIGLIQKIIDKIRIKIINHRISKAKYIHIMFNDKFNKPFVDFLNRNFDTKKHLILCKKWYDEFEFPQGKNVIRIKRLHGLDFSNAEKVIWHSLFQEVFYLYDHKDILREKVYWMIWGGDLYNAPRDKKNDFVRENFKGYITDVDGDIKVLNSKYNCKNRNFFNAGYTFPVTEDMINNAKKNFRKRDSLVVQINNSCDKSTLEMLAVLSKFKDKNLIVKTILSYGELEYRDKIIKKGCELFGDKFEYLDKILSPQEYANYVSENNILILNQNRQQGLGNSFLALNFGQKLFIRSEISTFEHLMSKGCIIFDTKKIVDLEYEEFFYMEEETGKENIKNSLKFFRDDYMAELWKGVFNER